MIHVCGIVTFTEVIKFKDRYNTYDNFNLIDKFFIEISFKNKLKVTFLYLISKL